MGEKDATQHQKRFLPSTRVISYPHGRFAGEKSLACCSSTWTKISGSPLSRKQTVTTHGDCADDDAQYVRRHDKKALLIIQLRRLPNHRGAHSGPGTWRLFFLANKR